MFFKSQRLSVTRSLVLTLVVATCSVSNAIAEDHNIWSAFSPQPQTQQSAEAQQLPAPPPKRTKSPDYIRNCITDHSNLPDMPHYTGKTSSPSTSVTWDARSTDRPSYDVSFDAREDQAAVLNWYKNSLVAYGWTIQPDQGQLLVAATKKGATCQIVVDSSEKEGFATEVDVFYR